MARRPSGEGSDHFMKTEGVYRSIRYANAPQGKVKVVRKAKLQRDAIKCKAEVRRLKGRRGIWAEKTTLSEYLTDWLKTS